MTDLSAPSLNNLAHVLRHPETWPEGFVWNHAHPHKNAVGLAFKLWDGPKSYDDSNDAYLFDLAKLLKTEQISILCTHAITNRNFYGLNKNDITPGIVANAIDAITRRQSL